jgi:hypothetical protein
VLLWRPDSRAQSHRKDGLRLWIALERTCLAKDSLRCVLFATGPAISLRNVRYSRRRLGEKRLLTVTGTTGIPFQIGRKPCHLEGLFQLLPGLRARNVRGDTLRPRVIRPGLTLTGMDTTTFTPWMRMRPKFRSAGRWSWNQHPNSRYLR